MPVESTRRRSATGTAPGRAGLFPQTMDILGNRWAFALLVAAFVGTVPVQRLRRSARRATRLAGRPPADLHRGRRARGERRTLPAHREGPRGLSRPDHRAAVGAALVHRSRGPCRVAPAHGVRQRLRRRAHLRSVRRRAAGVGRSAQASARGRAGTAGCCAPRAIPRRGSSRRRCRAAIRRAAAGDCATPRRAWRRAARWRRDWSS